MTKRGAVKAGLVAGLLGGALSVGCATRGGGGALPATYAGVVPCADCPGIRWTLNLYPDGVFRQRLEYLERSVDGRPARFDDGGRWTLEANGGLLVLRGDGGSTDLFAPRGDDTLRKLDAEGHEIPTTLNYDLKRAPAFAPF